MLATQLIVFIEHHARNECKLLTSLMIELNQDKSLDPVYVKLRKAITRMHGYNETAQYMVLMLVNISEHRASMADHYVGEMIRLNTDHGYAEQYLDVQLEFESCLEEARIADENGGLG